ncbi:hypothetical protein M3Y99_00470600 [Aphelenchoides fujianensis]|nr:hypothetical protein M3Y99_00470600 [Aphelenchoides fujianensis]
MAHGCLCSIHVHKGAFQIGIVGLVLSVFIMLWCIFFHSFVVFSIGTVSFCCYLGLVMAVHIESCGLYWPFLLLEPLVIFAELTFCMISFLVIGAASFLDAKGINSDPQVQTLIRAYPLFFQDLDEYALGFSSFMLLWAAVQVYAYSVVLRAFAYLRKVRDFPPPLSVGWNHRV